MTITESKTKIKVIHRSDQDVFEKEVNELLSQGYKIESTYCGFANSESYDFSPSYQAILSIEVVEDECEEGEVN